MLSRILKLEKLVKYIYCYVKNNPTGGESNLDLQQVTDNGNVTDSNIQVDSSVTAFSYMFNSGDFTSSLYSNASVARTYYLPDETGTIALLSDIPSPADTAPQVIVTDEPEYTIEPNGLATRILVTLVGSSTIVTLPTVANDMGLVIIIKNAGTSTSSVQSNPQDNVGIWEGGMDSPSVNLTAGSTLTLSNDGLQYSII